MNKTQLLLNGLAATLVGSNIYWWRRNQAARRGLTTSREIETNTGNSVAGNTELKALREASTVLNVGVTDLPERLATMDRQLRQWEKGFERLQRSYVDTWWRAEVEPEVDVETPHVVFAELSIPGAVATVSDGFAKQVGKSLASKRQCLLIAVDTDSEEFVVTVGESLLDEFDAGEIAADVVADADGGAGGTTSFARGGGDPRAIREGAEAQFDRLASEPVFTGNAVTTGLTV